MKYKQKIIPTIDTPLLWKKCTKKELTVYVKQYYEINLQGLKVLNKNLNIEILLSSQGKSKITFGSSLYGKKAAVVMILKKILEVAEYSNFGIRKLNDPAELSGYFNFKAKCKIDGKIENLRIAILLFRSNKIYFNHEINIIKK